MHQQLKHPIFNIQDELFFQKVALDIFYFQSRHNTIYKQYLKLLKKDPSNIKSIYQIPFLPIELFKTHQIISDKGSVEKIFTSSGTTTNVPSKHFVTDLRIYEESFTKTFQLFYGDKEQYCFLGLLPSYLEREGSSLVYMFDNFIRASRHPLSGYYLHDLDKLIEALHIVESEKHPTILLGVTYALLDLAEKIKHPLQNSIIMETGGMKGKRPEITKEELHEILCKKLGVSAIHSEYGMTELLSQAYSKGQGIFKCPPWMKALTYDTNDPFELLTNNKTGGMNIIDLANLNSCSFIQTRDLGKVYHDGSFEILGRFDFSDIRGCNLMIG